MAFTATQYLFKALNTTATTFATVGAYVVPAATRGQMIAMTLANTATTFARAWADVQIFDGTTAYNVVKAMPIDPGSSAIIVGIEKHTLPTGGAVYVNCYATAAPVTALMSLVEVT